MKIPRKAGHWVSGMRQTPEGSQVVANCRDEQNVPAATEDIFFKDLAASFSPGDDPGATMNETLAATPACDLCGPFTDLGLSLLTRFEPLARLPDLPSLRKAGISEQMLIRNPGLVDRISEIPLGNPRSTRNIVWAILEKDVADDIGMGYDLSDILNKLGVTDTASQPMYRAIYSANDVDEECHVPTVLDAGANHRFRPAKKGASAGLTKPCTSGGAGYPEFVHGKCMVTSPGIRVHGI